MNKQVNAVLTIIAGTIGVGFLALPYSIHKFGTWGGVIVLVIVGFLTLVTNFTYSDIITSDKGNRQIPGYTKKYLGSLPAHIITVIIIFGSLGILLAYGLISGSALKVILSSVGIRLSAQFLGLVFVVICILVMRYGMQMIAKVSSWAVVALIYAMVILIIVSLPNASFSNTSNLDFSQFSLVFGVSVFAMYSAGTVPVIDEIIGYNRQKYRKVVLAATLSILVIYIVFSLTLSLSFGSDLTSELVDSFKSELKFASWVLSILTLLATFTSFILVANNIKEVLNYDYKVKNRVCIFLILAVLIWALILNISDFETLVSTVGNLSLALQSLAIFAIWFKSRQSKNLLYKILVAGSGAILVLSIILQI
ncbi:hypothetical protein JW766_03065 [Candidatus Dojkabacteria bacterium]|nr:hypothetical protein [Candidatus Dojkabacteria bacterium]